MASTAGKDDRAGDSEPAHQGFGTAEPQQQFEAQSRPHGTYHLQRYKLRSLFTLLGPLALLGFYSFIVIEFLAAPPVNNIVTEVRVDARPVFYIWFILAVFTLEWARAGLANIEGAALMKCAFVPQPFANIRFTPRTATALMWHSDMKWSDPTWWLRAWRLELIRLSKWVTSRKNDTPEGPSMMWYLLSLNTIVLFLAIPLSGLTMELSMVMVSTNDPVSIYGPNSTSFNIRGSDDPTLRISNHWQSGWPTTPRSEAILYAPEGTDNVSTTFFDDQALDLADNILIFAGPAVRETVVGRAFGMQANISCLPVVPQGLKMLQIHDVRDYSVKSCWRNYNYTSCTPSWNDTKDIWNEGYDEGWPTGMRAFPSWLNISTSNTMVDISLVAVADGWWHGMSEDANPYEQIGTHDNLTFDHVSDKRGDQATTTAMFEVYIWQGTRGEEQVPPSLLSDDTGLVQVFRRPSPESHIDVDFYGVGVHCEVTTAIGYANLDPARRTYSSFEYGNAPGSTFGFSVGEEGEPFASRYPVPSDPVQILALNTIWSLEEEQILGPDRIGGVLGALHRAIGSAARPPSADISSTRLVLTPWDLQLALYRLLGDSVVALMDEGGTEPFYSELYSLKESRYLTSGVLSWIYVVILLSLWTLGTTIGALWLLIFAGPRWAPILGGFEMLRFGAQFAEELDEVQATDFQKCGHSLSKIPGRVGMLPGSSVSGEKFGFIGLNECAAETKIKYTFNRKRASKTRFSAI